MNATLRQHRALRRAAHPRKPAARRATAPAPRKRMPFAWAESWPAILVAIAVAGALLAARAGGAL